MGKQTILVKKRLVKSLLLVTSIFVAAMFIGSATAAGIIRSQVTSIEKTPYVGDDSKDIRSAPLPHVPLR